MTTRRPSRSRASRSRMRPVPREIWDWMAPEARLGSRRLGSARSRCSIQRSGWRAERSAGVAAGDAFAGNLIEQAIEERLRGGNERRGLAANAKVVRGQDLAGQRFARDFEAEDEDAACARGRSPRRH